MLCSWGNIIYQSSKAFIINNIEHVIEYQFIWAIIHIGDG